MRIIFYLSLSFQIINFSFAGGDGDTGGNNGGGPRINVGNRLNVDFYGPTPGSKLPSKTDPRTDIVTQFGHKTDYNYSLKNQYNLESIQLRDGKIIKFSHVGNVVVIEEKLEYVETKDGEVVSPLDISSLSIIKK